MRSKSELPVVTIGAGRHADHPPLMVGKPPVSISELIRAMGVTRTAIAEQLDELLAAGLVEQTLERLPGRGRPRHLYALTPKALVTVFTSHQRLIVPAIWNAIGKVGGSELTQKVIERASRSMAEYYRPRISGETVQERLRQLAACWPRTGKSST